MHASPPCFSSRTSCFVHHVPSYQQQIWWHRLVVAYWTWQCTRGKITWFLRRLDESCGNSISPGQLTHATALDNTRFSIGALGHWGNTWKLFCFQNRNSCREECASMSVSIENESLYYASLCLDAKFIPVFYTQTADSAFKTHKLICKNKLIYTFISHFYKWMLNHKINAFFFINKVTHETQSIQIQPVMSVFSLLIKFSICYFLC